jgi:hypothetical protein
VCLEDTIADTLTVTVVIIVIVVVKRREYIFIDIFDEAHVPRQSGIPEGIKNLLYSHSFRISDFLQGTVIAVSARTWTVAPNAEDLEAYVTKSRLSDTHCMPRGHATMGPL